jgi:hypothetical protein
MVYGLLGGYYKVMSNIPKMGQLPTPEKTQMFIFFMNPRPLVAKNLENIESARFSHNP